MKINGNEAKKVLVGIPDFDDLLIELEKIVNSDDDDNKIEDVLVTLENYGVVIVEDDVKADHENLEDMLKAHKMTFEEFIEDRYGDERYLWATIRETKEVTVSLKQFVKERLEEGMGKEKVWELLEEIEEGNYSIDSIGPGDTGSYNDWQTILTVGDEEYEL